MDLQGIHHLTAITGDVNRNLAFYTQVLGMRLVKKSVNQDDVSAYHLFYADAKGSPGTDLTFFDWNIPSERRGTRSIVRTGLRVAGKLSLHWWESRLRAANLPTSPVHTHDGRYALTFDDPEGQRLSLVDDGGTGVVHPWPRSPVPIEHQIRGLGPITISVPELDPTDRVLTRVMNLRQAREYRQSTGRGEAVYVYEMGPGGTTAELHVVVEPNEDTAVQGAGGVHHFAFRVPTEDEYHAWARRLNEMRIPNSGEVDRYYFRSLYFREPNGILFELATDGPGFATDEPEETLGERLALPPFLEPQRAAIEANLKPLG